jgi:hypothetical protein
MVQVVDQQWGYDVNVSWTNKMINKLKNVMIIHENWCIDGLWGTETGELEKLAVSRTD